MTHTYRWLAAHGGGLEHLSLQFHNDLIVADSVVVGAHGGLGFGCSYRVCCDGGWRVRSVELHVAGGPSCVLTTDGDGHWVDGDGQSQPQLAGCIDVDISATPFTNTLPIRRLDRQLEQRTTIAVAYILLPALRLSQADQAYTRLDGRRYLFEALDSGFRAEITVDAEALVLDYPGLFRRTGAADDGAA